MSPQSSTRALLRLLGNNPRLYLLFALVEPPKTAGELADTVGISVASARYHLHKLENAGLVDVDNRFVPRQYRPSHRVQIMRSRGKTEYSIKTGRSERIIFAIPRKTFQHKRGTDR